MAATIACASQSGIVAANGGRDADASCYGQGRDDVVGGEAPNQKVMVEKKAYELKQAYYELRMRQERVELINEDANSRARERADKEKAAWGPPGCSPGAS